jgi:hypothetical protein
MRFLEALRLTASPSLFQSRRPSIYDQYVLSILISYLNLFNEMILLGILFSTMLEGRMLVTILLFMI